MKFLELSIKDLKKVNKELFEIVKKDYEYDCVIFIARGSFIIGKDLAEYNNVPLLEIFAKRKGGKIKKILRPLLSVLPNFIVVKLREKEVKSNYHAKNSDRFVSFDDKIWNKFKNVKKILVVDDSVDTGYSIKFVKEEIEKYFISAEVRVAALNYFEKSINVVKTDYYLYNDTMLKGPWSNDSSENKAYLELYNNWHNSQK